MDGHRSLMRNRDIDSALRTYSSDSAGFDPPSRRRLPARRAAAAPTAAVPNQPDRSASSATPVLGKVVTCGGCFGLSGFGCRLQQSFEHLPLPQQQVPCGQSWSCLQ